MKASEPAVLVPALPDAPVLRAHPLLAALVVLLAAAVIFTLPIGRRPLFNQDEARFALLAAQAVDDGHWVLPRIRGELYLNKPPLFFWTVAALSLPFGKVTDATAPLASVLAALAGVLGVIAIGRRLWGFEVGLLAGAVLATAPFYFFMAHQVLADMMVTAWLTWALYCFLVAVTRDDRRWWVAFYLCTAGAMACKGPAALVVVLAAVVVMVVEGGWRGAGRMHLPIGLAVLGLSVLPWLLPYLLQQERDYTRTVLADQYVGWYFREKGSRIVHFLTNLLRFAPWTLWLVPAMPWWRRSTDGGRRQLLLWTATVAVAVSLSGEQRARYFLPVFPPLALLVAEYLARGWGAAPAGRRRRAVTISAAVMLLAGLAVVGLLVLAPATSDDLVFVPDHPWERWTIVAALVTGAVATVTALRRDHAGTRAGFCIAATLAVVLAVEAEAYPRRYEQRYDVRGFAERIRDAAPRGEPLMAFPDATLAYDFYARRSIRELSSSEVSALVSGPAPGALLVREDRWRALSANAHASWREVTSAVVGGRRFILAASD